MKNLMENMYPTKAILVGHEVVPEPDIIKWGAWYESAKEKRIVRFTLLSRRKQIYVSTVFLGLNHSFTDTGKGVKGIWFETMIFGTSLEGYQERYADWQSAERGHERAVFRARQAKWVRNPSTKKVFRKLIRRSKKWKLGA